MNKTLILHAGGGKTGSTALQKAFLDCRECLSRDGIQYSLIGDNDRFTSGNGKFLHDTLASGRSFSTILQEYFKNKSKSLISSEFFGNMQETHWNALLFTLREQGISTKIIFYARDIYPLYRSQWMQTLKSYQELDFEEFSRKDQFIHKRFFDFYSKDRGVDINILHYDSIKTNVFDEFLKTIGVDTEQYAYITSQENRSLTSNETDVFLRIHRALHGAVQTRNLWSRFASAMPTTATDFPIFPEIIERLKVRHQEQISGINKRYFKGLQKLKVIDASRREHRNAGLPTYELNQIALEWALHQLILAKPHPSRDSDLKHQ